MAVRPRLFNTVLNDPSSVVLSRCQSAAVVASSLQSLANAAAIAGVGAMIAKVLRVELGHERAVDCAETGPRLCAARAEPAAGVETDDGVELCGERGGARADVGKLGRGAGWHGAAQRVAQRHRHAVPFERRPNPSAIFICSACCARRAASVAGERGSLATVQFAYSCGRRP